jgi:ribonuclease HI
VKQIRLITDGSCLGNPGPGGWAAILRYDHHKKEMWGSAPHTTNNRMELTAAIEGLRVLRERCEERDHPLDSRVEAQELDDCQ